MTVDFGEHEIENDQVGAVRLRHSQSIAARHRHQSVKPGTAQIVPHQVNDIGFIIYELRGKDNDSTIKANQIFRFPDLFGLKVSVLFIE